MRSVGFWCERRDLNPLGIAYIPLFYAGCRNSWGFLCALFLFYKPVKMFGYSVFHFVTL